MERIPADTWQDHPGHVARYDWAASRIWPGETVNDIACGVGYGSGALYAAGASEYRGYDRPGVPDMRFAGVFYAANLDDPQWLPRAADVTVCFETLEHVKDPANLARAIAYTTNRAILVSVPTVPTIHINTHHLHDFTREAIPPMFPDFAVVEEWPQPEELSHVWMLERVR